MMNYSPYIVAFLLFFFLEGICRGISVFLNQISVLAGIGEIVLIDFIPSTRLGITQNNGIVH